MKLPAEFRGTVFEWLVLAPSALQVTAQLLTGFIAPGLLGVLFKYWQEITRAFWGWLAELIAFDISGLESIFDLYTLALLMLLAAAGAAWRKRPEDRANLRAEYRDSAPAARRRIALKATAIIMAFVIVFSISDAANYHESAGAEDVFGALLVGYAASCIFVYVGVEYYLGFPFEKVAARLSRDRKRSVNSAWFVLAWPGLAVYASIFTFIAFSALVIVGYWPSFIPFQTLYFGILAVSFLLLWLTHLRLNWPKAESIMDFTRLLLNLVFLSGLTIISLSPFAWTSLTLRGSDDKTLIGGMLLGGAIALVFAFSQVLKVDWRLPRTMLVIVLLVVVADQVLGFAASLVPQAA